MALSLKEIKKRVNDSYELPNNVLSAVPEPMVTIRTSTYQHVSYIKDCIEGVLMQKIDFPIEFIIGEDFSTDGTREIVFEYAKKYPDVIKVITADYNIGSRANGRRCIEASRGKYMAICEGDDYWTDPLKLSKQVKLLESDNSIVMVGHKAKIFDLTVNSFTSIFPKHKQKMLKKNKIILEGGATLPSNSLLFRMDIIKNLPKWYYKFPVGDEALNNLACNLGKVAFIDEVMSVYRKNVPNSWTSKRKKNLRKSILIHTNFIKAYYSLLKEYFNVLYLYKIVQRFYFIFKDIVKLLISRGSYKYLN